jgi:hypothetical protein
MLSDWAKRLCRDWLLPLMQDNQPRFSTKAELRDAAMRELSVSKLSFDMGWIMAIEDTGRHDWYEPLRRRRPEHDDRYRAKEAKRRLRSILRGAFSGPPTRLKDIPTRHGGSRRIGGKRPTAGSTGSARVKAAQKRKNKGGRKQKKGSERKK